MHEISLAGGILTLVTQARERDPFTRVSQLRIQVGALSGVEVSALQFALEAIAPGTVMENATFTMEETPGSAWCPDCSVTVPVFSRLDLCPRCNNAQLNPIGGQELRLLDLIVA